MVRKLLSCASIMFATNAVAALGGDSWDSQIIVGPNGMQTSCLELSKFSSGEMDNFEVIFNVNPSEWTDDMFNFLYSTNTFCNRTAIHKISHYTTAEHERLNIEYSRIGAKIRDIQLTNQAKIEAEKELQEKLKRQKVEQQLEAAEQAKKEHSARIAVCESDSPYLLYTAQESVIADLEARQNAHEKMAEQKKISRVSGVRDLRAERNIGEWLVQIESDIKSDWSTYKSLRGKAASPKSVSHHLKDPCASLR